MKELIEKIRNSDEAAKQRWVFGFTALSSMLVLSLWMGYFAVSVPGIERPKSSAVALPTSRTIAAKQAPGPVAIFLAGLQAVTGDVGGRLSRGAAMVKEVFTASNAIEVTATKSIFMLDGVEAVPETKLP